MYTDYFGLKEQPFSIAPDPRYLFMGDKHREALAHLIYGVGDQGGFVVLTGEVGTGKTTICRCLLQQVPDNADVAFIINPKQSINQLLQSIFADLGVSCEPGLTSKDLIDQLNQYLLEAHGRGRNTVLIIDEAQNLSVDVLEQLRLLTNLETNEKKLLQLVLLGQPELNTLLEKPTLRQLAQRVTARYHLEALQKNELPSYISFRLSVAGCRNELFSPAAVKRIYHYSKGVPRLINLLCDRCLLGVFATDQHMVTPKVVDKAAKEVFFTAAENKQNFIQRFLKFGVLAAAVIAAAGFYQFMPAGDNSVASHGVKKSSVEKPAAVAPENVDAINSGGFPALHLAFNDLLALWELPSDKKWTNCLEQSPSSNLFCHHVLVQEETPEEETYLLAKTLQQIDRPAILEFSFKGVVKYLLLSGFDKGQAVAFKGGGEYVFSQEVFQQLNVTAYYYLDRLPDNLSLPLKPGDSGINITAVKHLLNIEQSLDLTGREIIADEINKTASKNVYLSSHYLAFDHIPSSSTYDQPLEQAVVSWQQRLGFNPDGVIDRPLLESIAHSIYENDPVLNAKSERRS